MSLTSHHYRNSQTFRAIQTTHVPKMSGFIIRRPVHIIRAVVKNGRCIWRCVESTEFVDYVRLIEVFGASVKVCEVCRLWYLRRIGIFSSLSRISVKLVDKIHDTPQTSNPCNLLETSFSHSNNAMKNVVWASCGYKFINIFNVWNSWKRPDPIQYVCAIIWPDSCGPGAKVPFSSSVTVYGKISRSNVTYLSWRISYHLSAEMFT